MSSNPARVIGGVDERLFNLMLTGFYLNNVCALAPWFETVDGLTIKPVIYKKKIVKLPRQ